jgi:predicted DNA-binding WGR domain protein
MTAVELRRIDPSRNMRRFYRLAMESDLLGGFLLMRQWGRIGGRGGKSAFEHYDSESLALRAMQRQAERKRRRGYVGAQPPT